MHVTETRPVHETANVTRIVEQDRTIPVQRTREVIDQVGIKTLHNVTELKDVTRTVPVTTMKQVTENVAVKSTVPVIDGYHIKKEIETHEKIPITETVQVTKEIDVTKKQIVDETHTRTGTIEQTGHFQKDYIVEGGRKEFQEREFLDRQHLQGQTHGQKEIITEKTTITDTHVGGLQQSGMYKHDENGIPLPPKRLGLADCKDCGGAGYFLSNRKHNYKACRKCVKKTGLCAVCNQTGIRFDNTEKDNKCKCKYAH